MSENKIVLTEENVIDVYKALVNQQTVDREMEEAVIKRFYELVNYQL